MRVDVYVWVSMCVCVSVPHPVTEKVLEALDTVMVRHHMSVADTHIISIAHEGGKCACHDVRASKLVCVCVYMSMYVPGKVAMR